MDKQQEAIDRINKGESLFITGPGGVGKSWVINQILDDSTILCAPTGIAALNIGGATCHSVFGLPLGLPTESDFFKVNPKVSNLFYGNAVKRIIIDEVSMLRVDYLGVINRRLQRIRGNTEPFGGIQMVVVGDFYQLEPILANNERDYFTYDSTFCFTSGVWKFPTLELTEVKRQSNKRQVAMLNSIRKKDKYYKKALKYIQQECKPYSEHSEALHLCCYNDNADRLNQKRYSELKGEETHFLAQYNQNTWGKQTPVPTKLSLKIGAKVIICANGEGGYYVNGERGIVEDFTPEGVWVKREDGGLVHVTKNVWEKFSYTKLEDKLHKQTDAKFEQIPLRLGWAISIHKSQGMTLDDVAIDIGRGCFSAGQLYVALSRIRDLRNMSIKTILEPCDVIVSKKVKEFYGDL